MKETKLVFIPYQDLYNFLNDGIMTREYAILSRLSGIRDIPTIIINKPRTLLDGKRIGKAEGLFPEGSEACCARRSGVPRLSIQTDGSISTSFACAVDGG